MNKNMNFTVLNQWNKKGTTVYFAAVEVPEFDIVIDLRGTWDSKWQCYDWYSKIVSCAEGCEEFAFNLNEMIHSTFYNWNMTLSKGSCSLASKNEIKILENNILEDFNICLEDFECVEDTLEEKSIWTYQRGDLWVELDILNKKMILTYGPEICFEIQMDNEDGDMKVLGPEKETAISANIDAILIDLINDEDLINAIRLNDWECVNDIFENDYLVDLAKVAETPVKCPKPNQKDMYLDWITDQQAYRGVNDYVSIECPIILNFNDTLITLWDKELDVHFNIRIVQDFEDKNGYMLNYEFSDADRDQKKSQLILAELKKISNYLGRTFPYINEIEARVNLFQMLDEIGKKLTFAAKGREIEIKKQCEKFWEGKLKRQEKLEWREENGILRAHSKKGYTLSFKKVPDENTNVLGSIKITNSKEYPFELELHFGLTGLNPILKLKLYEFVSKEIIKKQNQLVQYLNKNLDFSDYFAKSRKMDYIDSQKYFFQLVNGILPEVKGNEKNLKRTYCADKIKSIIEDTEEIEKSIREGTDKNTLIDCCEHICKVWQMVADELRKIEE